MRVLGLDGLRASTTGSNMAAANLATLTLGAAGRRVLSALILVSCLGGCMSSLLTGSRVFVPLATDGLFVRWLGALSPRTAVPSRAVVVAALLGAGYVLVRSFEQLTEAFVVGYFPFYVLAVLPAGISGDRGLYGMTIRGLFRAGTGLSRDRARGYGAANLLLFCVAWPALMYALWVTAWRQREALRRMERGG